MTETDAPHKRRSLLDRYFGLAEHGTSVRIEFIAGLTTFLTMVYIVFVNPAILARPGWTRVRCSSPPVWRRRPQPW